MKRILFVLLVLILTVSLTACGSSGNGNSGGNQGENASNSIAPSREYDKTNPESVLNEIYNDFGDTTEALLEKEKEMFETVGETYEDYIKNKDKIDSWIELCNTESASLFSRTQENSALYFDLISKNEKHTDKDYLEEATDDYYDKVYDDALDKYYDNLYDDALDDLYDQYYDGIIDDEYRNLEYKEWSDSRSDAYKTWSKARTNFYRKWSSERSYVYGLWSEMRSEMIYHNNFDVAGTIAVYNKKHDEAIKKEEERQAIYDKAQDNAKALEVTYNIMSDGNAEVVGYSGDGNYIEISSEYDGHTVSRIADSAFENCSQLQIITIWADIESIGNSAFRNTGLLEISIPSSTTVIDDHAFENCTQLYNAIIWGNPSIGNYAFTNCKSIGDISISSDTPFIGNHAFEGCENAESLIVWGTEIIGDYAFANCKSIESLSIPSEVKSIGNHAFDGCSNLSDLIVWGRDTAIGDDAFANCPNLSDAPVARGTVIPVPDSEFSNVSIDSAESEPERTSTERPDLVDGMRPEFVEAMDAYEAYYDSYCEILKEYKDNPEDLSIMTKYTEMLAKLEEMDAKFEAWDDGTMNDAETKYYLQVNSRIMQKLAETY